jgi:tetratricopeptide (TPR) repeat protein
MSSGDEARKRILRKKFVEKALEACFDNELDTVREAFDEAAAQGVPLPVDPAPAKDGTSAADREDSFLGEAACGNAVDVVNWLLERGADVAYKGKYNRSPLQRALNNDALDTATLLLRHGADPRLLLPQEREDPSDEFPQGRVLFREWDPADVDALQCTVGAKKLLKQWDIHVTLRLLRDAEAGSAAKDQAQAQQVKADAEATSKQLEDVQAKYKEAVDACQKAVERRERLYREYDIMKVEGKPQDALDILEGVIKQAELAAKQAREAVVVLEPRYKKARQDAVLAAAAVKGESVDAKYDLSIGLSQIEDIITDESNAIGDRKVCLLIDRTGNALTFLTYRAVGLIDIGNSHHMHPTQLRLNVIGALRYGKPFVVNLRNKDLSEAFVRLQERFTAVDATMFNALIRGNARDPAIYTKWITDDVLAAHPEFEPKKFVASDTERFRFVLLTEEQMPQDWEILGKFLSVLVE